MSNILLHFKNITKTFPGVKALDDVSFSINKGEIHSILGENGAGKSTLMKILMGIYKAEQGSIILNNKEINPNNPHEAQNLGIGIVPQELNLVSQITVAENITLGTEIGGLFTKINWEDKYRKAKEITELLNINVNLKDITSNLSPGQQQMIQIARIIVLNCDVLLLDEPTATLTANETDLLFDLLKKLKNEGKTIIFISHKLEEVFEISDRITVLRDGKYITTKNVNEVNNEDVIKYMVGRKLELFNYNDEEYSTGKKILEVKNLYSNNGTEGVSFEVNEGEIIGFSGLVGAGRTELVNAIFGVDNILKGEIYFNGKKVLINSPKEAIDLGLGLIPEERRSEAILPMMNVKENITLPTIDKLKNKINFINKHSEEKLVEEYIDKISIKTPSIYQKIANLSGGNQQKVILARWLAKKCKLIIFDEPTRGIDIGAKQEIHKLIRELAKNGIGIIVISSELPELFSLTSKLYVMKKGRIISSFITKETSQEEIMNCILKDRKIQGSDVANG